MEHLSDQKGARTRGSRGQTKAERYRPWSRFDPKNSENPEAKAEGKYDLIRFKKKKLLRLPKGKRAKRKQAGMLNDSVSHQAGRCSAELSPFHLFTPFFSVQVPLLLCKASAASASH